MMIMIMAWQSHSIEVPTKVTVQFKVNDKVRVMFRFTLRFRFRLMFKFRFRLRLSLSVKLNDGISKVRVNIYSVMFFLE